jgi:HAD superfamily hydrolase (TIGR01509 family)
MSPESQEKFDKLQDITHAYEALLYDVDGTLADNMLAHKLAYKAAAAEYDIDLDTDLIDETAGWPTVAVAREIAQRYNKTFDFDVFSRRKSAIFIEQFIQETKPVDYVYAHLLANQRHKRIGIVSGGSRSTLTITLKVIDVEGRFETLVCAGDTPKGKPDPAPFLLAAQHLGVDPENCIVLEDGDPGVQGAINAGMGWVRIDQL